MLPKKGALMDILRIFSAVATGLIVLSLVAAPVYAQDKLGTGVFPNTSVIEQQLKRGVSTKADVQRLLGIPNGAGHGDMAPVSTLVVGSGQGPREIWYYDDIEITEMKSTAGVINANLRQQILLVFFNGEFFDGYLWTSNTLKPKAY